MAFLIVDHYDGTNETVETLEDVFQRFRDNEIADRDKWDHPTVYEIVRKVEIVANPATFSVKNTETAIPAPLPGETVSDYARRLTNG